MRLERKSTARILDFDVECRPLSWYGGDWVTKEITAIAWGWVDPNRPKRTTRAGVTCMLLGDPDLAEFTHEFQLINMLELFRSAFEQADIVTGHFIRGFDLPLINGACLELGMEPLPTTLVQDTKTDLVRFSGLSKSQENLGAMLGLSHPKVGMNQESWRMANRLLPEGIARTKRRVVGDVRQHVEMRSVLLDRAMLGPARAWSAGGARPETYTP